MKNILNIKQLLGWEGFDKDENNFPKYEQLNKFIGELLPVGMPEEELPIKYLLDNFQVPPEVWENYNKIKAAKGVQTIYRQMKTIKKQTRAIPKTFEKAPIVDLENPVFPKEEDIEGDEEPFRNAKEITDKIGNGLKNLIFTLSWLEKVNKADTKEYENDFVAEISDIIENTESRTQLALFVSKLNDVFEKDTPFD